MLKGLKSLLTGIIAGTAIGVLFAPKDGKTVREDIKKELDEGGTGLNTITKTYTGMGKDLHSTSKRAYEKASETEEFKKAKKTVKKAYKDNVPAKTRKKIKKGVKDAKAKTKDAVSKAKKAVDNVKSKTKKK